MADSCLQGLLSELYQERQEERVISYLPLSHVAGMLVDIINPLVLTAIGPSWTSVSFARPYDLKLGVRDFSARFLPF